MRFLRMILVVALIAAVLVSTGCGAIVKKAVESATGVSVDNNGDSTTVKGADGSELTVNNGEGKLAEGFPTNIPVYAGTIVDSSGMTVNNASTWTASIDTADSVDDIKAFYKKELEAQGWKITSEVDQNDTSGGRLVLFGAESGDLTLTVTINLADGKTTIGLLAGTKPK
ncbi:MAG: hypothetical protein Q8S43_05045 [Actinomycetota bacterium]|nr:hypothetical protein [Actinomycetota bacterium]